MKKLEDIEVSVFIEATEDRKYWRYTVSSEKPLSESEANYLLYEYITNDTAVHNELLELPIDPELMN